MARIWFAHPGKDSYSSTCCCDELKSSKRKHAVVAQLVEHHLAKVDVASSSLVNRSTKPRGSPRGFFVVSESFSFWRCWVGGDLLEAAAWVGWRPCYLATLLSDCRAVGGSVGRKNLQKIWGAKHVGERLKLPSEPPSKLL